MYYILYYTTIVNQGYSNWFDCFVVQTQKKLAIYGNICILQINLGLNIINLDEVCSYYGI